MQKKILLSQIRNLKTASAWEKGVKQYMLDLVIKNCSENIIAENVKTDLLNGAASWVDYSYGGCALCFDEEIAKRLCTNSELKRKDYGRLKPNSREEWLDVQARALNQATKKVYLLVKYYENLNK